MGPHDSTNPRHELVISLGDPAGIGMEVVLKALASPTLPPELQPLLVGCRRTLISTHAVSYTHLTLPTICSV